MSFTDISQCTHCKTKCPGIVNYFITWSLLPYSEEEAKSIKYVGNSNALSPRWIESRNIIERFMKQIYKVKDVSWSSNEVNGMILDGLTIMCCDSCYETKFRITARQHKHKVSTGGFFSPISALVEK
jgi:hypothetical protein